MSTTEAIAQQTFLSEDDLRFRNERTRKRTPKIELPTEWRSGPCCGRCANWWPPDDAGGFGECGAAVVEPSGYSDSRKVMTRKQAEAEMKIGAEPLRTRGFFEGCRQFMAIPEKGIAE